MNIRNRRILYRWMVLCLLLFILPSVIVVFDYFKLSNLVGKECRVEGLGLYSDVLTVSCVNFAFNDDLFPIVLQVEFSNDHGKAVASKKFSIFDMNEIRPLDASGMQKRSDPDGAGLSK